MRLVYLSPFPLLRLSDGSWIVEDKSWSGVLSYADHWPGDVLFASPGATGVAEHEVPEGHHRINGSSGVPIIEVASLDAPGDVIRTVQTLSPDIVLSLLNHRTVGLSSGLPVVYTAENDLRLRVAQARVASGSRAEQARTVAGLVRREIHVVNAVRRARGLQCNGPAAARGYGRFNDHVLEYMDHRLTSADVFAAGEVAPWDGRRPLRLGFSGRWTGIKGPGLALEATRILNDRLPGTTLTMFGGGELEESLRRNSPSNVDFAGFAPFETEWKSRVRQEIDVMLLPHVQGDPSCTYYESIGSGAPVIGFDHVTMRSLHDKGVAVAVKMRDVNAMVDAVVALAGDITQYRQIRQRGLDLVAAESWEQVNRARVEHLIDAVRARV